MISLKFSKQMMEQQKLRLVSVSIAELDQLQIQIHQHLHQILHQEEMMVMVVQLPELLSLLS